MGVISVGKLNLSDSATKEDFETICALFSSFPGIIEASTYYSYERFLNITLGYVHGACKKRKIGISELYDLARKIAKIINDAEKISMNNAQQEIATINKILIDKVSSENVEGISGASLLIKMNVDFNEELYNFFQNRPISKKVFINYLLKKHEIIQKYPVLDLFNANDFVDYLMSKKIKREAVIDIEATEMIDSLNVIIEEEKEKFKSSQNNNKTKYSNMYPGLTKSLLLIKIKEEINELITEYKKDELFEYFLKILLVSLSSYDRSFLRYIKVSLKVDTISNKIKETLVNMLDSDKVSMSLNSRDAVESAVSESIERRLEKGDYILLPKEVIKCIPDGFIERMIDRYRIIEEEKKKEQAAEEEPKAEVIEEVQKDETVEENQVDKLEAEVTEEIHEDEAVEENQIKEPADKNIYAKRLSMLISKYCRDSKNMKYSYEQVRKILDTKYIPQEEKSKTI